MTLDWDDPECRHKGGSADCPPACWLIFGDRFIAVIDWDDLDHWGQPGSNVHIGTTDDLGDHGRHCDETEDQ